RDWSSDVCSSDLVAPRFAASITMRPSPEPRSITRSPGFTSAMRSIRSTISIGVCTYGTVPSSQPQVCVWPHAERGASASSSKRLRKIKAETSRVKWPHFQTRAPVAQWIEQPPPKGQVARSIRVRGASIRARKPDGYRFREPDRRSLPLARLAARHLGELDEGLRALYRFVGNLSEQRTPADARAAIEAEQLVRRRRFAGRRLEVFAPALAAMRGDVTNADTHDAIRHPRYSGQVSVL